MDAAASGEPPRLSDPAPSPGIQDGLDWLRQLDWRQFEDLIAAAYRGQGYEVLPTAIGADGGIDLILTRGPERIFVQCKHWKAWQVGAPTVRELFGLVVAHGATGGVVVTSGRFSQEAIAFAHQTGVLLLDGPAVLHLVAVGRAVAAPQPVRSPVVSPSGAPACPICFAPMLLRKARRGPRAGAQFWGCSRYPGCKGVRVADGSPAATRTHSTQRARSLVAAIASLLGTVVLVLMAPGLIGNAIAPRARTAPPASPPQASAAETHAAGALGEQPMDIAVDPGDRRLYTANFDSGDVSVLDADTLLVVDTIDAPGQPVAVAVDPAAHTLYVADYAGRRVHVLDLRTGAALATLKTGKEPADLALDPARHRLFVANKADGTVWAYDTRTRRRTATLKVAQPGSLAIDARGGDVVVLTGQIAFTYRESDLARHGDALMALYADGIAFDDVRRRFYHVSGHTFAERNLMTGKSSSQELDVDARSICLDTAGRVAYVVDPDAGAVRRVDLA